MTRAVLAFALKDLKIELRKPHEILSALLFAFGSVFILGLGSAGSSTDVIDLYPVVTWMILYFASTFIFTSTFLSEIDQGTIGGLRSLPFSTNLMLYGKMLYCLTLLSLIMSVLVVSTSLFLRVVLSLQSLFLVSLVFLVSVTGFSLLGCLASAMLMFSEGRRTLIAFILLPISLPILIPCISSTQKIVEGFSFSDILPEMQLIVAFTIIAYIVASFGFDSLIAE